MPGDLIINQDKMQVIYNVKYPIKILFNQMDMGKLFAISGILPLFDSQLADMGVAKILVTQEYTCSYCMLKSITENKRTWVSFKAHFQEQTWKGKN